MIDTKLKRDIESSGGWFVGEYAALILEKYNRLQSDKTYKTDFVKQLFTHSGRDSDLGGTRTRVNALMRIIERHQLIEALEYIIMSNNIKRRDPDAIETAKQTLKKIKS